jgi:hypothetical protein
LLLLAWDWAKNVVNTDSPMYEIRHRNSSRCTGRYIQ